MRVAITQIDHPGGILKSWGPLVLIITALSLETQFDQQTFAEIPVNSVS